MASKRIKAIESWEFLKEHSREFLHIANLPPHASAEARIGRRHAADILRVGTGLANFAWECFMCRWDQCFHFRGSMVFIRFPLNDLLEREAQGSTEIVNGLKDFDLWQRAVVILNEGAHDREGMQPAEKMSVEEAELTISKFRAERAPSGEFKHNLFLQWSSRCSRMAGYDWMAYTVDGFGLSSWMPPKMHLRKRGEPQPGRPPVPLDERLTARAVWRGRLISTAGQKFVVSDQPERPVPQRGDIFRYPLDAKRVVKRWVLLG